VILRTSLAGDPSPLEVMRRVRATTLAAYAHRDLPFEELVENLERERSRSPRAAVGSPEETDEGDARINKILRREVAALKKSGEEIGVP
jgi:non-ribosomal peptide synthetase component F